jgi:hypothetical protein
MSQLQEVQVFSRKSDDNRETFPGRTVGNWLIVNRGRHLLWCIYDAGTGLQLLSTAPSLKAARAFITELDEKGLGLVLSGREEGIVWGDGKSFTYDSIAEIGKLVGERYRTWR